MHWRVSNCNITTPINNSQSTFRQSVKSLQPLHYHSPVATNYGPISIRIELHDFHFYVSLKFLDLYSINCSHIVHFSCHNFTLVAMVIVGWRGDHWLPYQPLPIALSLSIAAARYQPANVQTFSVRTTNTSSVKSRTTSVCAPHATRQLTHSGAGSLCEL